MPLYALGEFAPLIAADAFVHPDAVVIGNVTIGSQSSVWPSAVLRGDYGRIVVGERTSIQDGTVIHATAEHPTIVGNGCVVGHLAHLEGCLVEDDVLVGNGSIVMHEVVVGRGATIAAGAVVRNRMAIPEGALALGVPAVVREGLSNIETIQSSAALYVENAQRYQRELRLL
jgi:carbonic anhydrase/acetyltransferase-like protein (isoleucine patch superfamily)